MDLKKIGYLAKSVLRLGNGAAFESAREQFYWQLRIFAKDHNSMELFFLPEVRELRRRRSIRDDQIAERVRNAAGHILERLDDGAGHEEIGKLVDAQCRMMDYLAARPMCEAWDGQISLPRRSRAVDNA